MSRISLLIVCNLIGLTTLQANNNTPHHCDLKIKQGNFIRATIARENLLTLQAYNKHGKRIGTPYTSSLGQGSYHLKNISLLNQATTAANQRFHVIISNRQDTCDREMKIVAALNSKWNILLMDNQATQHDADEEEWVMV